MVSQGPALAAFLTIPTLPCLSGSPEHCGPASLLTSETLSPQAGGGCTALCRDKGKVPVRVNLGLHWAAKQLLSWMTLVHLASPPHFLADLLEPHESSSNSSKKGFFSPAGREEEDGRCKDNCQGQERKSEIGAGRCSGAIGKMRVVGSL